MRHVLRIACFAANVLLAQAAAATPIEQAETIYADLNDASSVIGAIDSGLFASYRGKDRATWDKQFRDKRAQLAAKLAAISEKGLSREDARVLSVLRKKLESFSEVAEDQPRERCEDAKRQDLQFSALSGALVACFKEIGNSLEFEGEKIDRASALARLTEIDDPARRKALFDAFSPIWQAVNGSNESNSPYRRLISMAAAEGRAKGSPVDAAARTVGVKSAELEQWLVRILEAWSGVTAGESLEPWNYRYAGGAADRAVAANIPRRALLELDHRFYRDLGADLDALGVVYDLEPRPDKSSVAYTDFLIHGRWVGGRWQPTIPRVLASYKDGNLGSLNELVHESGHAVQLSAIRNRPAFVDWNDDLFVEAFADVSSWSVYEPTWQQHYLGTSAPKQVAQRALFGAVMLDVAWALFETRMLRDPATDPNALWTDITHRYLHIVAHPDMAWWAVRVQLVDLPGYMVNYGLGAVLTAELRALVEKKIGAFDTGNPRWYAWLSQNLLRFGSERDTPALLKEALGRPVSPDALLTLLRKE